MQTFYACVDRPNDKQPNNSNVKQLVNRTYRLAMAGYLLCCLNAPALFAQNPTDYSNRGFEDGGNGGGYWNEIPGAVAVDFANTTQKRTGTYSLMHRVTNSTKQKIEWLNNQVSVPNNSYAHLIYYGREFSNSTIRTNGGIKFLPSTSTNNGSGTDIDNNSSFSRFTYSFQNTTGSTQSAYGFIESRRQSSSGDVDVYYDDFIVYASSNSAVDLAAPNNPSCLRFDSYTPGTISLKWDNGTDNVAPGSTGVQGTLILRLAGSSGSPALANQATYTTSTNPADGVNAIGSWTVVGDVPNPQNTFTDVTAVAGTSYRYVVVHYDLALNYSSSNPAINRKAQTVDISQSIQNISKSAGGTFTPGDQLRINVSIAVPSTAYMHNIVARINVPSGLNYVAGSMKILDNKGSSYTSGSAAATSVCYTGTSYTEAGSTTSLTDGAGDDRGKLSSGYVEMMLGEIPTPTNYANLEANAGNQSGGRIIGGQSKPRFYSSQTIIVASIDVTIPSGTGAIGASFPITSAVSYSLDEFSTLAAKTTYTINSSNNVDRFIELVVSNPSMPSSYANRGTNLFTLYNNGSFGSGTDVDGSTLPGNPNSSPNFVLQNITTSGQPNDGNFSVSKNSSTGQLPGWDADYVVNHASRVFSHWYVLGDHTGQSTRAGNIAPAAATNAGYMMLVNADYVPKRVVSQTLTGLCPGTFYNFKAWFRNVCPSCGVNSNDGQNLRSGTTLSTDPRGQGVKPNLTFDVNNKAYYTTGPIDTSLGWALREFVFPTEAASGNFNFSIRNNANGGDGNDWAIDDISIFTRGPVASLNVNSNPIIDPNPASYCVGQRFQVLGNWLESTSGFSQYDTYQFQYAYGPTGDGSGNWTAIGDIKEIPSPNDPNNAEGRIDSLISQEFTVPNQNVYFRVVIATQGSNITLQNESPCQVAALNATVIQIGSCVLPIKLLRFKAASFGQKVHLNWAAGDIERLQYFVIERSTNGVDFNEVKQVDPKAYETAFNYQLTDMPNAESDRLWYRLKMVHQNHEIKYSNIEVVSWKKQALALSIQPNPARETVQLNWSGVTPGQKVKLTISNTNGHLIHSEMMTIQQGPTQTLRLPNMPAGLYLLQVEDVKTAFKQAIKLNKL